MRQVRSDLEDLPKSFMDNPQAHLLGLCNAFTQAIDSYTNGKPNYPSSQPTFLQENVINYRALEKEIKRTRPHFEIPPALEPLQRSPPISPTDDDKKDSLSCISPRHNPHIDENSRYTGGCTSGN